MTVLRAVFILCWVLGVLLLAVGCREQKKSENPTEQVARVGSVSISRNEYEALLNLRAHGDTNRFANLDAKEALLDELIRREAILAKAKAAGFDQRPDIQESVKRMIVAKFEAEQTATNSNAPLPSQEEIAAYYQQHIEKFTIPAKAHGAMIFLKVSPLADAPRRTEAMDKADALLAKAKNSSAKEFAKLASENSDDAATRYQGGDIGWIAQGTKSSAAEPETIAALFTLKNEGDVAPLITTKKGVYIVKLLGFTSAGPRPLKEVSDLIGYTIDKEKRAQRDKDFYTAMKSGLDIRINQPLLESIHPKPASVETPAESLMSTAK